MALIYTNENIEQQVVNALRALGHDVLTSAPHAGIIVCSVDLDYKSQARRIHEALQSGVADRLVRVNRR